MSFFIEKVNRPLGDGVRIYQDHGTVWIKERATNWRSSVSEKVDGVVAIILHISKAESLIPAIWVNVYTYLSS